jgi:hypothetical protein
LVILGVVTTEALAVQYARPDGTNSAGGWTYSGASSLHEAVNEPNADDSNYMSATSDTTAELSLSSITDPVVHTGHVIRFRILSIGGGAKERCQVQLYDGANPIGSSAAEQSRDAYGTFTYNVLEAEATNISSYANLSVRIVSSSVGGGEEVRLSWVELEVPDATGAAAPTVILPTVTAVDTTSATLGATVDSNGGAAVTDRGNVWDTNPDPHTSDNQASQGSGTGLFTHVVSTLPAGTLIYYKGYATNTADTGYSAEDSFYSEPTVASGISFTNIADNSFRINWTNGGVGPTVGAIVVMRQPGDVNFVPTDGTEYTANSSFGSGTALGPSSDNYVVYAGTGTFQDVSNLSPGVTYYVAVYSYAGSLTAINYQQDSAPTDSQATSGGGPTVPTVITPAVSGIGTTSATLSATVDSNGGAAVTDRGSVWDTNPDPNTADNQVSEGSGTGFFTHVVSPLPSGSLIYYKGYAINSEGTGYSVEDLFYSEPTQSTNVNFTGVLDRSMTITWTRGNGDGSIVLVKAGSAVDSAPVDGTAHNASTVFESGDELGTGNYVVLRADANEVTVTGLTASTDYWVAVYEYAGSGSAVNYQQDTPADGNQATIESQGALGHNDAQTIYCDYCHSMHSALVPVGAGQETLCKSCHNEGGLAAETSDVNNHVVNGGSTIVDCGSCHEVHNYYDFNTVDTHPNGVTAENLSYIRWETTKYVAAANDPAVYHDPNVQAFSETPWNGMCQTCHTSTGNHRNDGTGDQAHEMSNPDNCTSCHTHGGGFEPIGGGGCMGCHDKVQDANNGAPTRAAVVGRFSLTSHHVADGNVTDADCEVCHYEAVDGLYHKDNFVDLRNPDTGSRIPIPSTGDGFAKFTRNRSSDTLEEWVTTIQDSFCMKCHDANGAVATAVDTNTPLRPFSAGSNDVPNVFDRFDTTNSFHHAVRGAGTNPYCIPSGTNGDVNTMLWPWNQDSTGGPNNDGHDVISCFDCHGDIVTDDDGTSNLISMHGGDNQRMLRSPVDFNTMEDTVLKDDLPVGMGDTVTTFCSNCHDSNLYVSQSRPEDNGSFFSEHPGAQGQHAPPNNELGCMGCHGGTVNMTDTGANRVANGSAKGNIHGAYFVWGSDALPAETRSQETERFMLGGWIGGYWKDTANTEINCSGGQCGHTTGRTMRY